MKSLIDAERGEDDELERLITSAAQAKSKDAKSSLKALKAHVAGTPLDSALFLGFATTLAQNYGLLVQLGSNDRHRSLTFEYVEEVYATTKGRRAISRLLGWETTSICIVTSSPNTASVFEIAVEAPEGAGIAVARLMTKTKNPVEGEFAGPGLATSVRIRAQTLPDSQGVVIVHLAASRSFMVGVLVTAVFAAIILTIGRFHLGPITKQVDAATTLLLAGPTLFAALVARPDRNNAGRNLLAGARTVLLLSGLWTFLAAGALVTTVRLCTLQIAWTTFAILGWTSAALLLIGVVSPGARRAVRRARTELRGPSV